MAAVAQVADTAPMRRAAALAVLCMLAFAAAAAAAPPKPERKRLRAADVALAKRTVLRPADLPAGWARTTPTKAGPATLACPGLDLDFSMFTITGTARSKFEQPGAAIESWVEVYRTRQEAAANFRKGATKRAMDCLLVGLRQELAKQSPRSQVSSARLFRPKVGEQSLFYRVVMAVSTRAGTVPVFMDFLAFQRGRTEVMLAFTRAAARARGQLAIARFVSARAR
jgi:hypothetical protein